MKKKIICIFVLMLLFTTVFPMTGTVFAGDEEDPEIEDESGDAFGYLDVNSVWFFEDSDEPEYLFVSMKINEPSKYKFQQTFAVLWKHDGVRYSCGLGIGFKPGEDWEYYSAGKYDKNAGMDLDRINGSYNAVTGIMTWRIPKDKIGNPQNGNVLTNTWSNAFRRLGFIGRIGFTRSVLDTIILKIFGNSMWDYAPNTDYGKDYIIQY